jgi:hypothetical protein
MPATSSSPSRASHPLHIFQDSLVIKPFSPTKRFFISACRSVAVIVFWGLLALVAGRILLPAVFKHQRQQTPLTALAGGNNGSDSAVVLSPAGQAALEAIGSCDLSAGDACPFTSLATSAQHAGDLLTQAQHIQEVQNSLSALSKSLETLRSDGSERHTEVSVRAYWCILVGRLQPSVELYLGRLPAQTWTCV